MTQYQQAFWERINLVFRKRDAYKRTFLGVGKDLNPDAYIVMRDLQKYCRYNNSVVKDNNGKVDPVAVGIAIGRREVYDRITKFVWNEDKDMRNAKLMENDNA